MDSITDAFSVARRGNHGVAASMLREEFENLRSSPQRVDLCEWIAHCFRELQDFEQAGAWYETAGQLILAEPSSPIPLKALYALTEYEKALDCYGSGNDDESLKRCSSMVRELRKACASA